MVHGQQSSTNYEGLEITTLSLDFGEGAGTRRYSVSAGRLQRKRERRSSDKADWVVNRKRNFSGSVMQY